MLRLVKSHADHAPIFPCAHRKNKFCVVCGGKRGSLILPASRVRGLPESLHDTLTNSSKGGVWTAAPETLGS